jgi:anti-anti-sigma regulatory factor
MPAPPIRADLITEGTYLVRVSGSLVDASAEPLNDALAGVLALEPQEVVVDATEASQAHGATLDVLSRAGRRAAASGGILTVACTDDHVFRLLEFAGADGGLALADGVGEAFAEVAARRYEQEAA